MEKPMAAFVLAPNVNRVRVSQQGSGGSVGLRPSTTGMANDGKAWTKGLQLCIGDLILKIGLLYRLEATTFGRLNSLARHAKYTLGTLQCCMAA
jgi:hypothetical protein